MGSKRETKGTDARAWFDAQSFHGGSRDIPAGRVDVTVAVAQGTVREAELALAAEETACEFWRQTERDAAELLAKATSERKEAEARLDGARKRLAARQRVAREELDRRG